MTWWQTAVVSVGSAVVGGLLTAWGTYFVFTQQTRERRREEAARFVGAALTALRQIDPTIYLPRLQAEPPLRADELMEERRTRWLAAAAGLDVLRARYPDRDVPKLAESVIRKGELVVIRLGEQLEAEYPDDAWWAAVGGVYSTAIEDAEKLLRALAQPAGSRRARFLGRRN